MNKATKTPAGGEEDIRYEIVLLGQLSARWAHHWVGSKETPGAYQPGSPNRLDYTAVLESTLLHARNLLEFLITGNDPTARAAVQFAPDWNPKAAPDELRATYGKLCEHLAHIGVKRQLTEASWNVIEISTSILAEFDRFIESATAGDLELLREGASTARDALHRAEQILYRHQGITGQN